MGAFAGAGSDSRSAYVAGQTGADGPGPEGGGLEREPEPAMDGASPGTGRAAVSGWACAGLSRTSNPDAQALGGAGEIVLAGDDRLLDQRPGGASVFRGQHRRQSRTDCGAAPGDCAAALKGSAPATQRGGVARGFLSVSICDAL